MITYKHIGFDELEFVGYDISEMSVLINHDKKTVKAATNIDRLVEMGLYYAGTKVQFSEYNGTEYDQKYASKSGLKPGDILTVKTCKVGGWSSSYTFEEVEGSFNTVMFELYA